MIFLNNGLTPQEREKVERPYAKNCRKEEFNFEKAGEAVSAFVTAHQDTFRKVGEMLDQAQNPAK